LHITIPSAGSSVVNMMTKVFNGGTLLLFEIRHTYA